MILDFWTPACERIIFCYFKPLHLRDFIQPLQETSTKGSISSTTDIRAMSYAFYNLVYVGIACFSLSLVFQLVTLPVEFNASRRALVAIEEGNILTDDELVGARKTLRAAAMTYVAAVATSLAQLLRLLAIYGNRRRRD